MKRGSGIKGRDDRSSGIEIRIADALAKINPTDPLILAKQAARRNLNCSDFSGISLARAENGDTPTGSLEASVVYYESIKRELKIRCIYECRCDERLQTKTKEFTRLTHTG
jgi:hypothetical protein